MLSIKLNGVEEPSAVSSSLLFCELFRRDDDKEEEFLLLLLLLLFVPPLLLLPLLELIASAIRRVKGLANAAAALYASEAFLPIFDAAIIIYIFCVPCLFVCVMIDNFIFSRYPESSNECFVFMNLLMLCKLAILYSYYLALHPFH